MLQNSLNLYIQIIFTALCLCENHGGFGITYVEYYYIQYSSGVKCCLVVLEMSPTLMQSSGVIGLKENSEQRWSQC